jgi:biopolymer transport protein ExbD
MIHSPLDSDLTSPLRSTSNPHNDSNMIPMINIVFLLLIFFMIAGQISIYDRSLIDPLSASEGVIAEDVIVVEVGADGVISVNHEPLTGDLLTALQALGVSETDTVICRIHHQLPASHIDPILAAFKTLRVSELQLVTRRST